MKWEACKIPVLWCIFVHTVGVTQRPITPPHHPSITPAKAPNSTHPCRSVVAPHQSTSVQHLQHVQGCTHWGDGRHRFRSQSHCVLCSST
ncbi:uncharacterized protein LACBIDRAFT_308245 [Laccaria bicolor S238N-H82]|uniref:Predicted protein n=1 Tax=Laccaria bicolor (strain S238N-H82 / ATCC MYA-4686) TaxID=486041 RepID=B0DRX3_LACBS|nr:uncharacterized protein LACBIDRAFT_308245 [Laccaria bicolor S238N-H82]EDR02690.1 predicted protein [Laccaria bicolor S238N-H82]|eukprot:XP_001886734.1 predicted protein [Laccaria bicolor S238N-H82]